MPTDTDASPSPNSTTTEAAATQGRLRVLHFFRRFHPDYTGDGIYYTRLIRHLAPLGIDNEILAYETRPEDGTTSALHEGFPVHYLANGRGGGTIATLLLWLQANLHRYDLVHLHSHFDRLFLSYALARLHGRPVLFSSALEDSPTQVLEGYRPAFRGVIAQLMRTTVSGFVVISPQLLRRSYETQPEERVNFIPQGVELDRGPVTAAERKAARDRLGVAPGDLMLLNVGSVSRRKNVGLLVEALSRIPAPSVKLVIVGPILEPDYDAELRQRLAEAGLEDRVTLAGFQSDPSPWYRAADAFAFTSTAEGFPNVYLEAMASSLPIITLSLPALTDFIVDHGRTGFLARDVEGLVEAIERLHTQPELRARMGEANRQFAERNLELGRIAESYAQLYREYRRPGAAPRSQPTFPDLRVRFTRALAAGPEAAGLTEVNVPADWPALLQVVIETGGAFTPAARRSDETGAGLAGLQAGLDTFRRHELRPCLAVDYPTAADDRARRIVAELAAEGCDVGVHLCPWTTPPLVEAEDDWHSFSGNLGPWLERAKLVTLSERLGELIGRPPRIFKAGRHGLGPDTLETLEELGFDVDLSIWPGHDDSDLGGPDFSRFSARPGWFGSRRRLLSLPETVASTASPRRLSPDEMSLEEMKETTRGLLSGGLRVFTLSVRAGRFEAGASADTLATIDRYLAFFREELGGRPTTPSELRARLAALSS